MAHRHVRCEDPSTLITFPRVSGPTSMLMLDIDRLKWWNSRIGHPGGDKVLEAVATVLRAETRAGDILARTGGEEKGRRAPGS
ncbi:diguanylate cyclase [Amycolatopsis sp. NPDC004079]|uniref:diguanylate cyclase n=1 Tax=Amycolatopsis sp. NPDC004079 TaxID=3154549 RepID=UPI0033B0E671